MSHSKKKRRCETESIEMSICSEANLCITQDVLEANLCFGEGSARVKFAGSSVVVNLCFSPFDKGRQESLPDEACRAWGLLKNFEPPNAQPPAKLVLSGTFASGQVQVKLLQQNNVCANRGTYSQDQLLQQVQLLQLRQHTCLGTYSLDAEREAYGRPVWKHEFKEDSDWWIASDKDGHWSVLLGADVGLDSPVLSYPTLHLPDKDARYPHQSSKHWQELSSSKEWITAPDLKCRAVTEASVASSIPPSPLTLRLVFENASSYHKMKLESGKIFFDADPLQSDASATGCNVAQQLLSITKCFYDQGSSASAPRTTACAGGGGRGDSRALQRAQAREYSGVIAQTFSYLSQRLKSLSAYCAICDERHAFGSMLQPTVCTRPFCVFRFAEFGKLMVGAEGLAAHAEVLDLLVATTTLAANSARAKDIFDPFPLVPLILGGDELALDPAKKEEHLHLARQVLKKFPTFERINAEVLDRGDAGLKMLMDDAHELSYGLFEWIRSSNRAHLASVPAQLQLTRIGARHQFVMLSAPPERQKLFDELKAKHGTTFVWHGSPPENWHGILRYGLKNCSNTKLMTTGASYGAGIYLSPQASMSFGYANKRGVGACAHCGTVAGALLKLHHCATCHAQYCSKECQSAAWKGGHKEQCKLRQQGHSTGHATGGNELNAFLSSAQLTLLALCEVATVPSLRKNGDIWVAPDEDSVVTRFLFAFPNGIQLKKSEDLNSQSESFEREVRSCLAGLSGMQERSI